MPYSKICGAMVAALLSVATAGCATAQSKRQRTESPGLYNLTGWNGWTADINGEVGHRMHVGGPTARCMPSRKWSGEQRIVSGKLPPGLTMQLSSGDISGIPAERGHWILKVELYNVKCGGSTYKGLTQELRLHITGSGRVVQ